MELPVARTHVGMYGSCLPQVPGISLCFKNGKLQICHVLPKHGEHTSLCLKELTVRREKEWELYIIHRVRLKWNFWFVLC